MSAAVDRNAALPSISRLDQGVSHRLAGGQLIVDAVSVVRELLENSLDAGATQVQVSCAPGDFSRIRVLDNGCGIGPSDRRLVGGDHCTSKLQQLERLAEVRSYGFRGEALHSTIGLSRRVEMVTRTAGETIGCQLAWENGERTERPCAADPGTAVTVLGLFQNLPVRLRLLKQQARQQQTQILHLLQSYALLRPEIRLRCDFPAFTYQGSHAAATISSSSSSSAPSSSSSSSPSGINIPSVVRSVFGGEVADNLVQFRLPDAAAADDPDEEDRAELDRLGYASDDGLRLVGACASPTCDLAAADMVRPRPDRMFLFVNGRCCESQELQKALAKTWRARVAAFQQLGGSSQPGSQQPSQRSGGGNQSTSVSRKFPFLVAHVWLRPELVDVNRSPDKRELLLPESLTRQLTEALDAALAAATPAPMHSQSSSPLAQGSASPPLFATPVSQPGSQGSQSQSPSQSPPDLLEVFRAKSALARAQKLVQGSPADPKHPSSSASSPASSSSASTPRFIGTPRLSAPSAAASGSSSQGQLSLRASLFAADGALFESPGSPAGDHAYPPLPGSSPDPPKKAAPDRVASSSTTGKRRRDPSATLRSMARHEGFAAASPASTLLARALVAANAQPPPARGSPFEYLGEPPHARCSASELLFRWEAFKNCPEPGRVSSKTFRVLAPAQAPEEEDPGAADPPQVWLAVHHHPPEISSKASLARAPGLSASATVDSSVAASHGMPAEPEEEVKEGLGDGAELQLERLRRRFKSLAAAEPLGATSEAASPTWLLAFSATKAQETEYFERLCANFSIQPVLLDVAIPLDSPALKLSPQDLHDLHMMFLQHATNPDSLEVFMTPGAPQAVPISRCFELNGFQMELRPDAQRGQRLELVAVPGIAGIAAAEFVELCQTLLAAARPVLRTGDPLQRRTIRPDTPGGFRPVKLQDSLRAKAARQAKASAAESRAAALHNTAEIQKRLDGCLERGPLERAECGCELPTCLAIVRRLDS